MKVMIQRWFDYLIIKYDTQYAHMSTGDVN